MMYCIQYGTLAPLLIKVKQKGKSDGNLLTTLHTALKAYLWLVTCLRHQEEIAHQHCVKETSLQFTGLSRLPASFIDVHLDAALSSELAHV